MKVVINVKFGGFGLSEAAYEKLIEWGVSVRPHIEERRDPVTRLYDPEPANDGEVIFDRDLDSEKPEDSERPGTSREVRDAMRGLCGRYWDTWTDRSRHHPLLIRLVEEMGEDASGRFARLKVVEIPDGVDYEIEEYDGNEYIAETHRTWV